MADHVDETAEVTPITGFVLSDKVYDTLNATVKYVLPALGTLYSALALLWGFPEPEKVVGTVVALATFFGVILALSKRTYSKVQAAAVQSAVNALPLGGSFVIDTTNPEKDFATLELETGFDKLADGDPLVLKVKKTSA
ncbi:hypothetical protein SEA_NAPOLEONB_26 [Arthrobacter phage NapoleonB]|uniref:Holin n=1 Tax=Arthrobacter phage Dynamite TaxID=2867479 RepID=A0AAE8XJW3_9CAUD|nr:holin [Arthrobacter phage Dynamite]QFP94994.1 hypothetical protein SEA_NAPOLEONB_26 [Arthrobacter phage NapoleonB]UAW09187.1 holin [Arthrobacter phage Dynamite]